MVLIYFTCIFIPTETELLLCNLFFLVEIGIQIFLKISTFFLENSTWKIIFILIKSKLAKLMDFLDEFVNELTEGTQLDILGM